nr:RES family NAD+ phosphorylase [Rhizobium setariae]
MIPTAYIKEPALTPLCDNDEARDFLEKLEGLTSSRLSPPAMPDGVDPAELLSEASGYGYTYVNAAFCYVKPGGNRFNDERRGAWYAAIGNNTTMTARAEVVFHLTRELDNTGVYDNITAYREVLAGFMGPFHDVRTIEDAVYLGADTAIAYPAGQAMARQIFRAGGNGIVYPSVRAAGGTCLVAFRPHLVQNIRLGGSVTFRWAGSREPEILHG